MKVYGLIGYPLGHSFSAEYFSRKFVEMGLDDRVYRNFPLSEITRFPALIAEHENLCGLNVTIPYKSAVIPYLDRLSVEAAGIGAVNTICFRGDEMTGHNTDLIGFRDTLLPLLGENVPERALILGSGGSAKTVAYVLRTLNIAFSFVSRNEGPGHLTYAELTPDHIASSHLIVNTTPLGMSPETGAFPAIDYSAISDRHILYDLIYNPAETVFLRKGRDRGAVTKNGLDMLTCQAEASWHLWNRE